MLCVSAHAAVSLLLACRAHRSLCSTALINSLIFSRSCFALLKVKRSGMVLIRVFTHHLSRPLTWWYVIGKSPFFSCWFGNFCDFLCGGAEGSCFVNNRLYISINNILCTLFRKRGNELLYYVHDLVKRGCELYCAHYLVNKLCCAHDLGKRGNKFLYSAHDLGKRGAKMIVLCAQFT